MNCRLSAASGLRSYLWESKPATSTFLIEHLFRGKEKCVLLILCRVRSEKLSPGSKKCYFILFLLLENLHSFRNLWTAHSQSHQELEVVSGKREMLLQHLLLKWINLQKSVIPAGSAVRSCLWWEMLLELLLSAWKNDCFRKPVMFSIPAASGLRSRLGEARNATLALFAW